MKAVAKLLYGSQNYHLDGSESDKDYKFLMCPDFYDLYNYHKVDKSDLPTGYDPEHYGVMSVINFDNMLRRGNVNTLELLFSREVELYDNDLKAYFDMAKSVFRVHYLLLVWEDFLKTLHGMMVNSLDRYGVNRKSASRAVWLLRFTEAIVLNKFALTAEVYEDSFVWEEAKHLRFSNAPLPTKEDFENEFQFLKNRSCNVRKLVLEQLSTETYNNLLYFNHALKRAMTLYVHNCVKKEKL